jgi:hypothetical protein
MEFVIASAEAAAAMSPPAVPPAASPNLTKPKRDLRLYGGGAGGRCHTRAGGGASDGTAAVSDAVLVLLVGIFAFPMQPRLNRPAPARWLPVALFAGFLAAGLPRSARAQDQLSQSWFIASRPWKFQR